MQGKTIQLKIATPEKLIYEAVVDHVSLPTVDGEITILPGHVSLITRISRGEIIAGEKHEKVPFVIVGGFAEINGESVIVLADYAEDLREITESHIETARARAEELKRMKEDEDVDFEHFETELERSLTRVKIADKYRIKKYQ